MQLARRQVRPSRRFTSAAIAVIVSATTCLAQHATFTQEQVEQGRQVYNAHCSECHASDLSGQSGPALAGAELKGSLEFSGMSARQLYDYIATQMPYGNPGSLSKDQYLQVLAYMLSQNNYPADSEKLTEQKLKSVELLPYPGSRGSQANKRE